MDLEVRRPGRNNWKGRRELGRTLNNSQMVGPVMGRATLLVVVVLMLMLLPSRVSYIEPI